MAVWCAGWDETGLPETRREVEINILRSSVHQLASFEKDYTGLHGQQNINKKVKYENIKVVCDMTSCILVYFIGVL